MSRVCLLLALLLPLACQRAEPVEVDEGLPGPPTELSLTAPGRGYQLDLSWKNSPAPLALIVRIVRLEGDACSANNPSPPDAQLFEILSSGPSTTQTWSDSEVRNGQLYCYVVFAKAGDGLSLTGAVVSGTPADIEPPTSLIDLAAVVDPTPGQSGVSLSWTVPEDPNPGGVTILRGEGQAPSGPDDSSALLIFTGSGTEVRDEATVDGVEYLYSGWMLDESGNHSEVATVSVIRPMTDDDGDGYTEADGDCDDAEDDAFPDAPSFDCSAVDWDCDGDGWEDDTCLALPDGQGTCVSQDAACVPDQGCVTYPIADMLLCSVTTDPELGYDVCVAGVCVSPGSTAVSMSHNVAGPHFPLAPAVGHSGSSAFSRAVVGDEPLVTDLVTGLMWQGCASGLRGASCDVVSGTATHSWADAVALCDGLSWGGHDDWYLPDGFELQSLVDYGLSDPPLDTAAFPGAASEWFWTTQVAGPSSQISWYFGGAKGEIGTSVQTQLKHVRCARRGDPGAAQPLERFLIQEEAAGDWVVVDQVSGLMWQRCIIGRGGEDCAGSSTLANWIQAATHCEQSEHGGHQDWRLPDIKELRSLAKTHDHNLPYVDAAVFPHYGRYVWLWSSTPQTGDADHAWALESDPGRFRPVLRENENVVRCVRDLP